MVNLHRHVGDMEFDGLITDIYPHVGVGGGVIRKSGGEEPVTYKRGTLLAVSGGTAGDGALVIMGSEAEENETLTPFGILCDDIEVGTDADEKVAVYVSGCFDPDKLIVADEYELTATDIDNLRIRNIALKAAADAN
ncbi:MAG TPA: head decoration protein [Candidatus Scatomorpha merdigallinarum]|nr:head decoration protein [Candidatus Scatomorpha merdigallinarum]